VATFFGPVTLVWFIAIAIAGLWHVGQNLAVLYAFDPIYGVEFLASHGLIGLVTLGAVFLAVTGSETLYAALGHFGRGPIRLFRSSSALASAYGIAVSGTRVVTAMMAFVVVFKGWPWPIWAAALLIGPLPCHPISPSSVPTNVFEGGEGGWIPLALGGVVTAVMYTWGIRLLFDKTLIRRAKTEVPLDSLVASVEKEPPHVVPGTAVLAMH
jgi:K+ transporter